MMPTLELCGDNPGDKFKRFVCKCSSSWSPSFLFRTPLSSFGWDEYELLFCRMSGCGRNEPCISLLICFWFWTQVELEISLDTIGISQLWGPAEFLNTVWGLHPVTFFKRGGTEMIAADSQESGWGKIWVLSSTLFSLSWVPERWIYLLIQFNMKILSVTGMLPEENSRSEERYSFFAAWMFGCLRFAAILNARWPKI